MTAATNFIRRTGIDGDRADIAAEFRRQPFGRHSPDLRCVLNYMRASPSAGKHFLVTVRPGKEWMLGQMNPDGSPTAVVFDDVRFCSLEAAEWHVFKLRWRRMFDCDAPEDL